MDPAIVAQEDGVLGIDDQYPLAGGNHRERRKTAGERMPDDGDRSRIEQRELTGGTGRLGLSGGIGNTWSGRGIQGLASRENVTRAAWSWAKPLQPREVAALHGSRLAALLVGRVMPGNCSRRRRVRFGHLRCLADARWMRSHLVGADYKKNRERRASRCERRPRKIPAYEP